jgi:hypothetical protein
MSICAHVVAAGARFDTAIRGCVYYILDTDREEGWELEKIIREGAELKKKPS